MPWGARRMRFALHKAWYFILGCAGGWLHPMLCERCLSGSVPGGCFSKVEDIAPFSSWCLSGCWPGHTVGTVNKHGVAWCEVSPQAVALQGPKSTAAPLAVVCFPYMQDLTWCHRCISHCSTPLNHAQSPGLLSPSNETVRQNKKLSGGLWMWLDDKKLLMSPTASDLLGEGWKAQCLNSLFEATVSLLASVHCTSHSPVWAISRFSGGVSFVK